MKEIAEKAEKLDSLVIQFVLPEIFGVKNFVGEVSVKAFLLRELFDADVNLGIKLIQKAFQNLEDNMVDLLRNYWRADGGELYRTGWKKNESNSL